MTKPCMHCPTRLPIGRRRLCDPCRVMVRRRKSKQKYEKRRRPPAPDKSCRDCGHLTKRGPLAIRCLRCWRIAKKLKDKWGLSRDDFDRMLAGQGGVCAICRNASNGHGKFHVDHDHQTGAIRGLLCGACNMGMGQFRDRADILRAAADYLTRYAEKSAGPGLSA